MNSPRQFSAGNQRLSERQRRLALFGALSLVLWVAFAKLVVPSVIENAYLGLSVPWLNALITGQSEFPVTFYLQRWDYATVEVGVWIAAFWALCAIMTSESFARRLVGEVTPGTLGAIRMWTCTILLITTLWDDLGSIALLPLEYRTDMGLMKILHALPIGFDGFLTSQSSLRLFQRLTEVLLLLGAVGWQTRLIIPLCALFTLVANGILREYTGFWHQNLVPVYTLVVLSFTPCGDGWSIDRLRRIYQGRPVPDSERRSLLYGWARYACWVPISITYASAGFSKLRASGLGWVSARNMRGLLYEQTLYPRAGNFSISLHLAPAPDFVFVLLGIAAVAGEALFITVLFSRTCRKWLPAITILMHTGIIFLQNIVFFDLMLLLLIFYDFELIRQKVAQRMQRAGSIRVFYDGACALCRRTVRILGSMDQFDRLVFDDFRRLNLENANLEHAGGLTLAALENEMFVTAGGKSYSGFVAYRVLSVALPPLWPVAPWLYVPGVPAVAKAIYGYVARHRQAFLKCDHACSTETIQNEAAIGSPVPVQKRFALVCGVAVAAVIACQGFLWFNKIEYYPFTSVQMFTGKPGTVVTYYKTVGHWESGRVSPVRLEDTIAVLSINSRYEDLFAYCFGDAPHVVLCSKVLAILGSAYNGKVHAGDKLTQLEIQRWKWDFGAKPRDPNYGELDTRFIGDVRSGGGVQGVPVANNH